MKRFSFKWQKDGKNIEGVLTISSSDFKVLHVMNIVKTKHTLHYTPGVGYTSIPKLTKKEQELIRVVCNTYYAAVNNDPDVVVWNN
jgi:hypothetical protein